MSSRGAPPAKLLTIVVPVWTAGLAAVAAALLDMISSPVGAGELAGIVALLCVSMVAERYPVPLQEVDAGGVSLGFVFGVSAVVLFGWAAGTLVLFAATVVIHSLEGRPPIRVAYNAAVFGLGAAMAGVVIAPFEGDSTGTLLAKVAVAFGAQFSVNVVLVSFVVAFSSGTAVLSLLGTNVRQLAIPCALMASATLTLVVLWQRSPFLSIAIIGPLLAIALYQRSTHREMRAMRLALTDPLTGLGNHRHFQERLQRELVAANDREVPLTLCLLDVDDFKQINDRFGHPAGDRLLAQLATRLRHGGEAFRLGGDEFAILLPGHDAQEGHAAAGAIVERIAAAHVEHGPVTVSAGIATFPAQGVGRDELIRLADSALYWAKEHGKNQVRAYRPDVVELAELKRLAAGPDRTARYRAAATLARAVDARDVYQGSHSERVAELAARIAARLGADAETIELTRVAARLHDLGKLAVPEEILRKRGPLSRSERNVIECHPQIGFRMLAGLGIGDAAEWVLHHHERWDGSGYPEGLAAEEIPLGARIIFVADAYDALTSDRPYGARMSAEDALRELERCSGTQFDPEVVAALSQELVVAARTGALAS